MDGHPSRPTRSRSRRIHLAVPQVISFSLLGSKVQGELINLSMTGGLARVGIPVAAETLAKVAFDTASGKVRGVVRFMAPNCGVEPDSQPFQFIALGPTDHARLASSLSHALPSFDHKK